MTLMELIDAYAGANTHARSLTGMMEARTAVVEAVEKLEKENAKLREAAPAIMETYIKDHKTQQQKWLDALDRIKWLIDYEPEKLEALGIVLE